MHPILQQISRHFDEQPVFLEGESPESLLDLLYSFFAESARFSNETIKGGFADVRSKCSAMTPRQVDELIDTVCMLCHEHERLAFIEGIKVGIALEKEID